MPHDIAHVIPHQTPRPSTTVPTLSTSLMATASWGEKLKYVGMHTPQYPFSPAASSRHLHLPHLSAQHISTISSIMLTRTNNSITVPALNRTLQPAATHTVSHHSYSHNTCTLQQRVAPFSTAQGVTHDTFTGRSYHCHRAQLIAHNPAHNSSHTTCLSQP